MRKLVNTLKRRLRDYYKIPYIVKRTKLKTGLEVLEWSNNKITVND
jgi:hypothetical protein